MQNPLISLKSTNQCPICERAGWWWDGVVAAHKKRLPVNKKRVKDEVKPASGQ